MDRTTRLVVGGPFVVDLGIPVGLINARSNASSLRLDAADTVTHNTKRRALWAQPYVVFPVMLAAVAALSFAIANRTNQQLPPLLADSSAIVVPNMTASAPVTESVAVDQVALAYPLVETEWKTVDPPLPVMPPGVAQDFKPANATTKVVQTKPETTHGLAMTQAPSTTKLTSPEVKPKSEPLLKPQSKSVLNPAKAQVKPKIASPALKPLTVDKPASVVAIGLKVDATKDKVVPSAVVLNEDDASTAPINVTQLSKTAIPPPADAPQPPQMVTLPPAVQMPKEKPSPLRLVAIAPDGKSVVFSDPVTRLPVQFKVGQRLPNGDTVVSIDASMGKITTSSKEYTLD